MPIVDFETLPDSSRIWVYGSDKPIEPDRERMMLDAVDDFLGRWAAHGAPLHSARRWDDGRFLTIAVDSTQENASGCSIDGLFRTLRVLEHEIGVRMLGGGRVFYRANDSTEVASRDDFADLAAKGTITRSTPVFDTSLTTAVDWRTKFEQPAGEAWTAGLF